MHVDMHMYVHKVYAHKTFMWVDAYLCMIMCNSFTFYRWDRKVLSSSSQNKTVGTAVSRLPL